MTALAVVLLVVGYPVALGVLARLRPVLRERRRAWFLVLEAATVLISVGWLLLGRAAGPIINGLALVAFAGAWWWTGRRQPAASSPGGTGPGS
ncbi:MAG: hypothetical protein QOG43_969 [Actinomycetota bacterium]|jgi:hypothetical protein|nr:hypothetical protein [Actinomycetota bacterium]